MQWQEYFRDALTQRQSSDMLRRRRWHVDHSPTVFVRADGRKLVNFGSNDYLGIRHDARLAKAAGLSLRQTGSGAGASPLITGYNSQLAELERRLARWQQAEAALVFTSGFSMNVGVISALVGSEDLVLSDQLNHASLIDGCKLSRAHKRIFAHNDVEAVRNILANERQHYARALLICESIYSMDGDAAPLKELTELCLEYEVGMLVDEAHATGVYGTEGAGLGSALGIGQKWLGKLGTLSKAIGTSGGFVTGSQEFIEYLVNNCRSYIYSTAIAPPVVAATIASLDVVARSHLKRERLCELSTRLRAALQRKWPVPPGDSPIVPVIVGSASAALNWQRELERAGCYVPAIRQPTVPAGTSRLRISLSAEHTDEQLNTLISCLVK